MSAMNLLCCYTIFWAIILCHGLVSVSGSKRAVSALRGLTIAKCCPRGHLLNVWHNCVPYPGSDQPEAEYRIQFRHALCLHHTRNRSSRSKARSICKADDYELDFRHSPGQMHICPWEKQFEMSLTSVLVDGSLEVIKPKDRSDSEILILSGSQRRGCVDLALNALGAIEGPVFRTCLAILDKYSPFESLGQVKKCCPGINEVIDPVKEMCVESDLASEQPNWIPVRQIAHPGTHLAFSLYEISWPALHASEREFNIDFKHMCSRGMPTKEDRVTLLTDGTVQLENSTVSNYVCADRYISRSPGASPELSDVVAFSCLEDVRANTPSSYSDPHCLKKPCVPKCCDLNESFDATSLRCVPSPADTAFTPTVHERRYPHRVLRNQSDNEILFIANQLESPEISCANGTVHLYQHNRTSKLLEDGTLYFQDVGAWDSGFCIDYFILDPDRPLKSRTFSGIKCHSTLHDYVKTNEEIYDMDGFFLNNTNIVSCTGMNMNFRLAYIVCGLVSLIFLLLTLFIYTTLPHLRNLHGKIVVSNVISILATTFMLLVMYNVRPGFEDLTSATDDDDAPFIEFVMEIPLIGCKTVGYLVYYMGIAMFFWMSVMCFDLCWTFVRAKIPRKGSDRFKFFLYSVVAWGCPLILLVFLILVDNRILDGGSTHPNVGVHSCFLSIHGARVYFYLPILILLCFNTVSFLVTVYTLWKSKRFSRKAGIKRISSRYHHQTTHTSNTTSTLTNQTSTALMTKSTQSPNQQRPASSSSQGSAEAASKSQRLTISNSSAISKLPTFSYSRITSDTREELFLFTKLFFVMGLSWFLECFHVELHGDHSHMKYCNFYTELVLRILGGLNMIRGFFIFLVFIWKKSIWRAMKVTHPRLAVCFSLCFKALSGQSSSQEYGAIPTSSTQSTIGHRHVTPRTSPDIGGLSKSTSMPMRPSHLSSLALEDSTSLYHIQEHTVDMREDNDGASQEETGLNGSERPRNRYPGWWRRWAAQFRSNSRRTRGGERVNNDYNGQLEEEMETIIRKNNTPRDVWNTKQEDEGRI